MDTFIFKEGSVEVIWTCEYFGFITFLIQMEDHYLRIIFPLLGVDAASIEDNLSMQKILNRRW